MTVIKSITSFPVLSLPSTDLAWKPEPTWTPTELQSFITHCTKRRESIKKMSYFPRTEDECLEVRKVRYLLSNESGSYAWAELQIQNKIISRAFILYDTISDSSKLKSVKALTPLITSTFLMTEVDTLRIIALSEEPSLFPDQSYVTNKELWSIIDTDLKKDLRARKAFDISGTDWMNDSENLMAPQLKSLKARLKRQKAFERTKKAPPQPRRGILSRLFRPRVDDSLF